MVLFIDAVKNCLLLQIMLGINVEQLVMCLNAHLIDFVGVVFVFRIAFKYFPNK